MDTHTHTHTHTQRVDDGSTDIDGDRNAPADDVIPLLKKMRVLVLLPNQLVQMERKTRGPEVGRKVEQLQRVGLAGESVDAWTRGCYKVG